jgi:hypothetical protein
MTSGADGDDIGAAAEAACGGVWCWDSEGGGAWCRRIPDAPFLTIVLAVELTDGRDV